MAPWCVDRLMEDTPKGVSMKDSTEKRRGENRSEIAGQRARGVLTPNRQYKLSGGPCGSIAGVDGCGLAQGRIWRVLGLEGSNAVFFAPKIP